MAQGGREVSGPFTTISVEQYYAMQDRIQRLEKVRALTEEMRAAWIHHDLAPKLLKALESCV
jgi:hypothetical protein